MIKTRTNWLVQGTIAVFAVLALSNTTGWLLSAQAPASVLPGGILDAYDFETLTVTSGAVVSLTSTKLGTATSPSVKAVQLTCETATIRYRYDGTDPTSAVGHELLVAADKPIFGINNIRRLRFIASSATGTVRVTFLR